MTSKQSRRKDRTRRALPPIMGGIDPWLETPNAAADLDDDDALLPEPLAPALPSHFTTSPATNGDADSRLDKWLADRIPDLSRSRLKTLIETGHVTMDGVTIDDPSARVKPGQMAVVDVPEAASALPEPQAIPLDVIHEDGLLVVVDKPAGMVVHPAVGNHDGTLVNALLHHCGGSLSGIGGVRRPGIVHRIDKDTSGLMVAAKTDHAHHSLAAQFAERSIERAYYALVWGTPKPSKGDVEGNIGRSASNRQKMAVIKRGGKPALTRYRVLKSFLSGAVSLVECRLATGRTHQIRVHMAYIGHTLIGDPVYGSSRRQMRGVPEDVRSSLTSFPRQALHAYLLGFNHPHGGQPHRYESSMPEDMQHLIDLMENLET